MNDNKKSIRRALMIARPKRVGKEDGGGVSGVDDVVDAMKEGFGDRPLGLPPDVRQRLETPGSPTGLINRDLIDPVISAGDAAMRAANAGVYGLGSVARQAYDKVRPNLPDQLRQSVGSGAALERDIREMPGAFMGELGNVPQNAAETAINIAKKPAGAAERGMINLSSAAPEPTFYSPLERGISEAKQAKASPQEWKAIASKFPKEEADWRGLNDFLDAQTGSVTRDQVLAHLKENPVDVQEVWKGGGNDRATELRRIANTRGMTDAERDELIGLEKSGEADNSQVSKYHEHVLPGGENYREMLLTLPEKITADTGKLSSKLYGKPYNELSGAQKAEVQNWAKNESMSSNYRTNHWSEPNILAHVRMNDRTGPNGEKLLHLEEIQSDWGQQAKERGFKQDPISTKDLEIKRVTPDEAFGPGKALDDSYRVNMETWRKENGIPPDASVILHRLKNSTAPNGQHWNVNFNGEMSDEGLVNSISKNPDFYGVYSAENAKRQNGLPRMPFGDTKDWTALALKRVLRHAADNGYHGVTWTTGAQQADRYDLSKHVNEIHYEPVVGDDGKVITGHLTAYDHNDAPAIEEDGVNPERLAELIGKDAAKRIIDNPTKRAGTTRILSGQDLRVGGHGMVGYYDSIVPSVANKLGKPHGAQVGKTTFDLPGDEYWAVGPNGRRLAGPYYTPEAANIVLRQRGMSGQPGYGVQSNGGAQSVHYLPIKPSMKGKAAKMFQRGGRVDHDPTEAQKSAGNYRKEHTRLHGLDISIENKSGSTRSGKDANGKSWSCTLPADYGYIKGTEGADGDHVDCYIGPDKNSQTVFIINQHDHKTDAFDEHKVMIGFNSEKQALETYCKAFSDGKGLDRLGSIETVSMDAFKKWLKSEKTTKPAHSRKIVEHALRLVASNGSRLPHRRL